MYDSFKLNEAKTSVEYKGFANCKDLSCQF